MLPRSVIRNFKAFHNIHEASLEASFHDSQGEFDGSMHIVVNILFTST